MCVTRAPKISGFAARISAFAAVLYPDSRPSRQFGKRPCSSKGLHTAHFCRLRLQKCLMVCTRRPPGGLHSRSETRKSGTGCEGRRRKIPGKSKNAGNSGSARCGALAAGSKAGRLPWLRRFGIYSASTFNGKNCLAGHLCRMQAHFARKWSFVRRCGSCFFSYTLEACRAAGNCPPPAQGPLPQASFHRKFEPLHDQCRAADCPNVPLCVDLGGRLRKPGAVARRSQAAPGEARCPSEHKVASSANPPRRGPDEPENRRQIKALRRGRSAERASWRGFS